jgi:regulator of replication initiation timing
MKFATKWTDRRKDNLTEHLELRKELREELDTVKEELHQLQKELDEWREKYYHQVEVTTLLQAELAALRNELSEYKDQTGEYSALREPKDD